MSTIDWIIVLGLNLLVFGYGLIRSRETRTNLDWFLGGRNLPFWIVAVSLFATSVDSGDIVGVNGMTYVEGITTLTTWWLGVVVGYVIAAFFVLPPMYRAGMFTNAEYLEYRFGPAARVVSALVQVQYRTNILAGIAISLQLTLTLVMGLDEIGAWIVVAAFASMATLYSARGGLKTIAWVDALLTVAMITGVLVLWSVLWNVAGGWSGAVEKLTLKGGPELPGYLLHIGVSRPGSPDPLVVTMAWLILGAAYPIVNHSETMKLFGARSLWDVKVSVLMASGMTMILMYFNGTLGILGRAVWPETLQRPDQIYPLLVNEFLGPGLKGIVVAGVIAAAITTYEGIGSALAALCTRDIYARLFVKDREDSHYFRVSRWVTPFVVAASFAYIPFILRYENIAGFFIRVTSVFVIPLMTVYLVGVFTRAHRRSGIIGLAVGSGYGILALVGSGLDLLPVWFTDKFAAYAWSIVATSGAMILTTLILGRDSERSLAQERVGGWLDRSRRGVPELVDSPFEARGRSVPWWAHPNLWGVVVMAASLILVFYVFW